ncbi:GTPase IMAP family member 8-like [Eucyclogobius newberryi]|uniref:GTPase IMAP family member 8-like n=1 Tax=Eucyclogobius newberryi TaxID=166745 RepID=UPI003B5B4608
MFLSPVSELRLVLLGNHWSLKVSVGELLLGKQEFDLLRRHDKCVKVCGTFKDKPLTVINSPDRLNNISPTEHDQFIKEIKVLSSPGPHVFLLVLQPEDFTEQHRTRQESVLESFSEQVFHRSLVLMFRPRAETPESREKYMSEPHIRDTISRCRYRCLRMDYTEICDVTEFKRKELFSRVSDILKENKDLNPEPSEEEESKETYNPQSPNSLRIAVIGRTGNGKSSSGKTILGTRVFKTKPSQNSITKVCEKAQAEVDGRTVYVVDTPGLFDTTMSSDEVNEEMLRCVALLAPGPHVFLWVLQIGRFTPEENKTFKLIKETFGKNSEKYTIILFTHGDKLVNGDITIEEYIKSYCNDFVKELILKCGNKYHVFNNNCGTDKLTQVKELMIMIDEKVKENEGSCFSTEMLFEAKMDMIKHMRRKLEEQEEKIKEKEDKVEKVSDKDHEKESVKER